MLFQGLETSLPPPPPPPPQGDYKQWKIDSGQFLQATIRTNFIGILCFMQMLCFNCVRSFQSCVACTFPTFSQLYLAFPTCCLLMEINSVFLHVRRLMRYHQMNKFSHLYRFNVILVLVTFVVFRFIFVVWMENTVITHRQNLYLPHFLFGFFGINGMITINVFLFIFLCKAEFGGKTR